MGGGGSSGQTQQQNQYSSLASWAQPYVTSILGAAQQQVFQTDPTTGQLTGINPYNAYGSYNPAGGQYGINPSANAAAQASVAGFTPLQQQQQQNVQNLQNPWQTGVASGQTLQSINTANQLGASATPQDFQQQVGGYMNPYINQVLQPSLQLLNQQYGQQGAYEQGAATNAGAFGGSREAVMQGLNQQNQNLAANQLVSNAYNNAFNAAQNQYNQSGAFALQAANQAAQNAGQLGQLGTQGLANQQNILNMQGTVGGQQQQQQQNIINQAMQNYGTAQGYGLSQLGQLKNLVSGLPISDVTTTQQAAAPSVISQLAPIATGAVAGYNLVNPSSGSKTSTSTTPAPAAKGGIMEAKRFDSGGITAINRKVMLAPDNYSKQTIDRGIQDGTISKPAGGIAEAIQLSEQANTPSKTPPPTSTVVQDLKAKVAQTMIANKLNLLKATIEAKLEKAIEEGHNEEAHKYAADLAKLDQLMSAQQGGTPPPAGGMNPAPQPQQLAVAQPAPQPQPMPQGIDVAQSNLPTQTAQSGGVMRLAGGTDSSFWDWWSGKDGSEKQNNVPKKVGNWLQGMNMAYFGGADNRKYDTSNIEDESGRGTITPEQLAYDKDIQSAIPAQKDTGIIIHDTPKKAVSAVPTLPPSTPTIKPIEYLSENATTPKADTSGITSLLDKYEKMINESYEDPEKAKSRAGWMRLLEGSLGAIGEAGKVGTGRSAFSNYALGAQPAFQGYMQDIAKIDAAKTDKVKQLLALGLTGEQLKMEAEKLGISKAELPIRVAQVNAQIAQANTQISELPGINDLRAAQAYQARQTGNFMKERPRISAAGLGGGISNLAYMKLEEKYDGYKAMPSSAPFFSKLPAKVQDGLTNYGSKKSTYIKAKEDFDYIADKYMENEMARMSAVNRKSAAPTSEIANPFE